VVDIPSIAIGLMPGRVARTTPPGFRILWMVASRPDVLIKQSKVASGACGASVRSATIVATGLAGSMS